jgi:peptidoglycan endopeptidase LytE
MMRRQIFMWMGLIVLFFAFGISQEVFATGPYEVKQGDTLSRISKKFSVSIDALKEANDLKSDALKPHQTLVIPQSQKAAIAKSKKSAPAATTSYVVKKGDNLFAIAGKTGVSIHDLKRMNHIRDNRLRTGQRLVLAKTGARNDVAEAAVAGVAPANLSTLPEGEELEEDEPGSASADEQESADGEEESAELLGKWESSHERQLLARVAMGFLGAPYRLGGSSVKGLDCSAFVKKIYAFFDINLPRTAREQARVGKRIPRNELEIGDLVFFNTRRAFGHVGVYIGNNEFVHASSGRARSVKVDTLDKPYYNKRFVKAVRLKDLDGDL